MSRGPDHAASLAGPFYEPLDLRSRYKQLPADAEAFHLPATHQRVGSRSADPKHFSEFKDRISDPRRGASFMVCTCHWPIVVQLRTFV
jgi:hypothetical protein